MRRPPRRPRRAMALPGWVTACFALSLPACGSDDVVPGSHLESGGGMPAAGGAPAAGVGGALPGGAGGSVSSSGGGTGDGVPTRGSPYDHVSARDFTAMLVEVDYVSSAPPSDAAIDEVLSKLSGLVQAGYLRKPDGLRVVDDQVLEPLEPTTVNAAADLQELVSDTATVAPEPWESLIHVVYVDGGFEEDREDARVLGLSYAAKNVILFKDNIRLACDLATTTLLLGEAAATYACDMSEAAVLLHEIGHVFGLVDNGIPLQSPHHDEEHGAHCTNTDCLMYYAAERSGLVARMVGRHSAGARGIPDFGPACLADLAAAAAEFD